MTYRDERIGRPSQKIDLISNPIYSIEKMILSVGGVELVSLSNLIASLVRRLIARRRSLVNEGVSVATVVKRSLVIMMSITCSIKEDYSCRDLSSTE
jgi:hypothetical protein